MRKVVITGLGVVSPVGSDLATFWDNLTNGRSGIGLTDRFDTTDYPSKVSGQVAGFDLSQWIDRKEARRMDPYCHYGVAAAQMAATDSGLDFSSVDGSRMGCLAGSGIGGIQTLEEQHSILMTKGPSRCSPFMIPQMISNIVTGLIAIRFGMRGPNFAVVSACASAAHSIGEAAKIIARGDADVMIAGGAEAAVCSLGVSGFCAMKALSTRNDDPTRASRPFDAGRDGFVIAEGAGIVVLEELEAARARGARIYCEVAGFGMTCDAYHITAPIEDGNGARRAMQMAMSDAGVGPESIDYINAHGTSTNLNDKIETKAIKEAFGETHARRVMISSTKSMTGHLLGAAAGIETAVCALVIRDGIVPPTINQETPDPDCDLDYVPNVARRAAVKICLNNSLGFGGHNACLCLRSVV